jgi:hypothetical protein
VLVVLPYLVQQPVLVQLLVMLLVVLELVD